MAFNPTIDFWTTGTVADGSAMSAPLQKLLENDNFLKTMEFDSICETQAELLSAITSATIHTILWKGNTTLIDFVATAGTFKLIYCQHYSLLGKNSTLVAPAGKNITIYGDIDCDTPATGGFSWILNSTATSSIKCKWIRNSGVTGKVICDAGTVLYERKDSALTLQVNGTLGSESYITQEFWDNTNNSKITNDTIENNTWYLDTINGDDNNSGLSRYSPKKTTLSLVNAVKIASKSYNRISDLSASGSSVFVAAQWTDALFPFDDVVCESINNTQVWVGTTTTKIINIIGGTQVFNGTTFQHGIFVNSKQVAAQSNSSFFSACSFNSSIFSAQGSSFTGSIEINTYFCSLGENVVTTGNIHISSYNLSNPVNGLTHTGGTLDIDTTEYYAETITAACSSIATSPYTDDIVRTRVRINARKNMRHQNSEEDPTPLLKLTAFEDASLDYIVVMDYIDSATDTIEILSGSAGTISGKVIELLKYEDKLESEIERATAVEALKADLVNGIVPSSQLPSYVDDVLDVYIVGSTPYASDWLSLSVGGSALIPESGKIYIVLTAGSYELLEFRWSGTVYAEISKSIALGETSSTAYRGDRGKAAYDHSLITSGNPHGVSKSDVSLGNVDNVSDANKPVSTAQAAAIAAHANLTTGMHGLPALDHFVYGDTIYGGSLVDNLNTLSRTMPFTCYGTAIGVPSADYSWFGWHINSNAGVAAAVQILWAFNSSSVICYERVKTSNMWGTWELQGTTGTVRVDSTNSPFAASGSATTILASTNTGDVVITMPVFNKKQFNVKWDEGVHNLTIVVANGGMIDGQSSYVVNDLWAVKTNISLLCKESGIWFIV